MNKIKLLTFAILLLLSELEAQFTPNFPLFPNAGNTNANIDRVGIGNWGFFAQPQSRFHINNFLCFQPAGALNGFLFRTDGNQNVINRWQMFTGPNAATLSEKGTIYTSPLSTNGGVGLVPTNSNFPINHMNIQATQGDIIFRANGNLLNNAPGSGVMNDRVRITAVHFTEPNTSPTNSPFTRVAISSGQLPFSGLGSADRFITNPLAMLHMGDLWVHNGGAHRPWMNYGTFISRVSDGAYFGIRQNEDPLFFDATDRNDCVIAWGDNPTNIPNQDFRYDRLRIIFNTNPNPQSPAGLSANTNGLEVMRFSPINTVPTINSQICYVGIGDFSTNNSIHPFQDPVRKLEILSDKLAVNANGNPQLRLTNFQQNPASPLNTGRFAEFHSTIFGDLEISAKDNTQVNTPGFVLKERFVGINTNTPNNTLEINSQYVNSNIPNNQPPSIFGAPTGWAGLRFSDLRSTSIPQANPGNGVLSINSQGDVIYVPSASIANNGLSVVNGTVQLGIPCPAPSASAIIASQLLSDRQIPMNTFNFVFSGQTAGSNRVGIGTGCSPGNKLEIDNGIANANTSGLRLTQLTSNTTPIANPGQGVLSVSSLGDVIYVPGGSSAANNGLSVVNGTVQLGATCGSPTAGLAALTNSVEVPLANNSLIFSETAAGNGRVGIGKGIGCAPGNQLEVNAGTGPNSLSGLRLTDLANNPPALANPFNKVLAVNNSGDVILTNLPPTGGLGNSCGLLTNPLPIDWEIPLNNFNFRFQGNGTGTVVNNVGIGTSCLPQAKLHVDQSSGSIAGSMGLLVENNDVGPCNNPVPVVAIKGIVNTPTNTTGDQYRIAGWFEAPFANNCGLVNNYALYVPQNGGNISFGFPVPTVNNALLNVNGNVYSTGSYNTSDVSLKNTVNTLPNSLNKIKNLRPVTFKWNTTNDSLMTGIHAGFIAQEVDTVIPQVVRTNNNGIKSISYTEMIPYLVSAMQQLIKQNKQQDSLIQVLTQNITSCCSNTSAKPTGIKGNDLNQLNIELTDKDFIVLNQNQPNPFAEQTTITYNVPEKYGFAQLVFKTLDGKIIKTVDITKKGKGVVNVFASDLSNGLYMYSLIVDGDVIDTKKMVKQN